MHLLRATALVWLCLASAFGADQPTILLAIPCAIGANCDPTRNDLKKAKEAFSKGLKLEKARKLDRALEEFDTAARLSPKNIDYLTGMALVRQQLVYQHLQEGNKDLQESREIEAQAEFRGALNLDPDNDFAQQRLKESMGEWLPKNPGPPQMVSDYGLLHAVPEPRHNDFHFRGDSRELLTEVARSYGISVNFDESVVSKHVLFDVQDVDFATAMDAAGQVTGTFWSPLSEKEVLIAKESELNHRQFDRMAMRSFYIPGATQPQDLTEVMQLLRIVFDIRFFGQQTQNSMITVRAPVPILDAITKVLEGLGQSRPQVMLDVEVFQIDHQLTRDMGIQIPNQFNLYNIPAAALAALGGQSIQDLVNQLISGGGINQASSQGIAGLIAQLQGQQNSIFSQPLATFGNGLTLFGVSLGTLSGQLSVNESWVKDLQHSTLRASQNSETSFKIGERYPILNASFAPVFNTAAISQVLQNQSFQAPFPSVSYEDIGLTIKAKPVIHADSSVSLGLDIQMRSLAGQSLNGVPVISSRQYKGNITLEDGEPAVVAGAMTDSEQLSLTGIPGLGSVPGLNKLMTTNSKMSDINELLVVITPHVVSHMPGEGSEVWISKQ
jgi:hypothetical protein